MRCRARPVARTRRPGSSSAAGRPDSDTGSTARFSRPACETPAQKAAGTIGWSPRAPRRGPTTSISPASRSSSTGCTCGTTGRLCAPGPGSCTLADSTRSPTTWAGTTPCGSFPPVLPSASPARCGRVPSFSGGTFASVLTAFSRPFGMVQAAEHRRRVEKRPADRRIRTSFGPPRRDSERGMWLAPRPTLDPRIVARSAAALPEYGPDFTYRQYAGITRSSTLVGGVLGLGALALLAQVPPARRAVGDLRAPGTARASDVAGNPGSACTSPANPPGGGCAPSSPAATRVMAKPRRCSANPRCACFDDLPSTAGQVTTAVAMGSALLDRLRGAGLTIRTIDGG